ncbi:MAG: DUF3857 domain-containing protein, partial [Bacteroidota bacterium]
MADLERLQQKWPGEPLVVLRQHYLLDIKVNKKGGLTIRYLEEEAHVYTSRTAQQYAERSMDYSGQLPLSAIEAYTLVPDGDKYRKKAVEEFTVKDAFSAGVFHDGSKTTEFLYPGLVQGAQTVLNYSLDIQQPQFIPGVFLKSGLPIETLEFTILCDPEVELGFSYVNMPASDQGFAESTVKKRKKYVWRQENIARSRRERRSPNGRYYLPHIIPRVKHYTLKGEKVPVLEDLSDLHGWYASLIKDVNQETSDELKAIVDSLTAGVDDELEKVRNIYYWVQDNVKYIAFEEGMEGFIPKEASQVCQSRYGDCKGMSSIIHAMLKEA